MRPENSPLVRKFTYQVLRVIYLQQRYNLADYRDVINIDLIPHISEEIMKPLLLNERKISPFESKENSRQKETELELKQLAQDFEIKKAQMNKNQVANPQIQARPEILKNLKPSITLPQQKIMMSKTDSLQKKKEKRFILPIEDESSDANVIVAGAKYGKIELLLHDPTVTLIECYGPGKFISIIRAGQRHPTKIALNQNEINEILQKMADEARIPLIEGIFRAAVEDFVVHSIISNNVGVRFIIKKYTPYSLLDST